MKIKSANNGAFGETSISKRRSKVLAEMRLEGQKRSKSTNWSDGLMRLADYPTNKNLSKEITLLKLSLLFYFVKTVIAL